MDCYIGCDAHKRFSQFVVMDEKSQVRQQARVSHERGNIRRYLQDFPQGTGVALETVGNWYWIADEIEAAGCEVHLTHAAKAKLMMGQTNKTDKLDARGLARLLRNGTLPSVWLAPGELRDERELPRTRMALSKICTSLKNRIHATFAKYGMEFPEVSDVFGVSGRKLLLESCSSLPPETRRCFKQELETLKDVEKQINILEKRIKEKVKVTEEMKLLKTMPGVGTILAIVMALEVGDVGRFPSAGHFASYSGTVPRVQASGGKVRYGRLRQDVNRYLKWAFIEAANAVVLQHKRPKWRNMLIVQQYLKVRKRKGHARAVGALARRLAESAYWVLKKREDYKEPKNSSVLPKRGQAR